jgi:hypothetical protein
LIHLPENTRTLCNYSIYFYLKIKKGVHRFCIIVATPIKKFFVLRKYCVNEQTVREVLDKEVTLCCRTTARLDNLTLYPSFCIIRCFL